MARKVFGKVNARIKFISRYAGFSDTDSLMVLATGLVQSHFDYACCLRMTDLSRTWMIMLQKSQNKLIRLVLGLHCFSRVDNIHFQQLGWLPIERRLSQKVRLVHKIINNRAPVYFNSYFSRFNVRHGHFTRESIMDINLCRYRTLNGQRPFKYSSAKEWNMLPLDMKVLTDCEGFIIRVKRLFLDRMS